VATAACLPCYASVCFMATSRLTLRIDAPQAVITPQVQVKSHSARSRTTYRRSHVRVR
jgi:hypothetical protein